MVFIGSLWFFVVIGWFFVVLIVLVGSCWFLLVLSGSLWLLVCWCFFVFLDVLGGS